MGGLKNRVAYACLRAKNTVVEKRFALEWLSRLGNRKSEWEGFIINFLLPNHFVGTLAFGSFHQFDVGQAPTLVEISFQRAVKTALPGTNAGTRSLYVSVPFNIHPADSPIRPP